jgi:membrane-bound serine protease (ClpP class)
MVRLRRAVAGAAFLIGLLALVAPLAGASPIGHVTRLKLIGIIDQINATYIEEGIRGAGEGDAVAVLIEIDSPGGELTSMDRIVQAILGSEVPVITWVTPEGARAGSAATMITLAGDVAAMSPNTNIGAASVISGTGEDLPQTLGEKITNDQVARITELARAHGRNEAWAESAVREAASIAASGAVAMRPPVVDLLAATTDELFAAIDLGARADGHRFTFNDEPLPTLGGLIVVDAPMNLAQQFLHVLSDPNIAFILFTIGFYGILAELFHPNFFSGPVGAIAIVLAFIGSNSLPLNVGGLLLILLGIGLFVLEVNVTSHGLLAIGGIVCFTLGAFALYTRVDENTFVRVEVSPWLVAMLLAVSLAYFGILVRGLIEMRRRSVSALPVAALQGAIGTAQTLLAPAGIAYAGGESWSARSRGGEIAPGATVRVVGMEGLELIVEPVDQPTAPGGEANS